MVRMVQLQFQLRRRIPASGPRLRQPDPDVGRGPVRGVGHPEEQVQHHLSRLDFALDEKVIFGLDNDEYTLMTTLAAWP